MVSRAADAGDADLHPGKAEVCLYLVSHQQVSVLLWLSSLVSSDLASEFIIEDEVHELVQDIDYTAAPLLSEGWITMRSGFSVSET